MFHIFCRRKEIKHPREDRWSPECLFILFIIIKIMTVNFTKTELFLESDYFFHRNNFFLGFSIKYETVMKDFDLKSFYLISFWHIPTKVFRLNLLFYKTHGKTIVSQFKFFLEEKLTRNFFIETSPDNEVNYWVRCSLCNLEMWMEITK